MGNQIFLIFPQPRHITRPMFAVISYGWHICVPLAPFAFDGDIMVGGEILYYYLNK